MLGQLIADSIGICLLNDDALLTSVGNELLLHRTTAAAREVPTVNDSLTGATARAFDENADIIRLNHKIHGIVVGNGQNANKILIYGEREFMLLSWSEPNYQLKKLRHAQVSDWINAAVLLNDAPHFALHTSHSVLVRIEYTEMKVESPEDATVISENASCTDKSMLYGTHLHGTRWRELIVISGNAFGELLIWQPVLYGHQKAEFNDDMIHTRYPLLHRIAAHNGVIYSIDYNPHAQLLTTTSDDRSIKFWRVDGVQNGEGHSPDWRPVRLQAMVSGYGHTSRVFQGRIIEHDNTYYAITVGEDSNFCLWRADGEMLFKRREQFGATIWNFTYDALIQTLYTVGSTGNVLAYSLQSKLAPAQQQQVERALPSLDDGSEYVAKVHFISCNTLIGVTNKNRLLYNTLMVDENQPISETWKEACEHIPTTKCTAFEVYGTLVAFCGYKRLTLYEFVPETERLHMCYDNELLNGVIRSFQFLNANTFLVSDEVGNCLLLKGKDLAIQIEVALPQCKEPWLTTALLLPDEKFLLVSNRKGNVLLYEKRIGDDGLAKYGFTQKLLQPHGHLGATILQHVDSTVSGLYIRSAGHDGTLKLLHLNKTTGELKIHMKWPVPIAWVENICTIRNEADELADVVFGFNDNRFVAWSQKHDILLQLPCGGGHRCWDFQLEREGNTAVNYLNLVYIKQKRVTYNRTRLFNECRSNLLLPQPNQWHTSACNVLRVLTYNDSGGDKKLIVSAGEDNLLKIYTITAVAQLEQQHELFMHISSIRCMQLMRLGDDCLIFSGGGRAQLCISKINLIDGHVQELSTYTLSCNTESNAEDDDCATGAYKPAAETRIMALGVRQVNTLNELAYHLYLGCSDGYLRLLYWSPGDRSIPEQYKLLHTLNISCCVLQVELIPGYVLVTGTDGVLYAYSNDLQTFQLEVTLHENGINALDALVTNLSHESDLVHVLTGGDDQTVNYTQLCLIRTETESSLKLVQSRKYQTLHSAQVTAAALHMRPDSMELYGCTGGLDQNIVVINLQTDCIKRIFPTSVADIKGLCLSLPRQAFIYGAGLQILQFD